MIRSQLSVFASLVVVVSFGSGCVTVAEHRKLEKRVIDMERGRGGDPRENLADLSAEVDSLAAEVGELRGRLEVAEKTSADALEESRRVRRELATRAGVVPGPGSDPAAVGGNDAPGASPAAGIGAGDGSPAEVASYRAAYASWRANQHSVCIDQFRKFLQTYPASAYADDAAFWMADCHFKQGDYKNAVLRFDDVVRNYPTGNKAPDALYRQGESLLKLGPGYHEAAKRAFERVVKEYPDSARANEARDQIDLLAKG